MAEGKTVVVPLTGPNYCTWKIQCKMSLMRDGLWGIVSKTEAEPEAGTERHTKFATRRDRALAIIVLSVDPSLLYLLGDPTDAAVIWEKLSSQFQKKTWANRLALRKRLHSMLLKDGQNVQEHVKNMIELFNELAIVGDNISDEDRVVYLLASLPESFDVLVTALEASSTVPQMETVIERLLHTERKLKEKDLSNSSDAEGAMSLKHKKRGPQCHHCGKFGHIQRNCRDRKKEEKPQNSDAEYHHRRPNYKPKQKANSAEIREQESSSEEVGLVHQHVFAAGGVNEPTQSGTQWIIDSGATSHICSDRNLFTDLKKLNHPLDVVLGDGRALLAKHSGTVHLQVKSGSLTRKCKLHNVLFVPELAYCLLSISKATERGIEFKFNKRGCIVRDSNGRLITVASKSGNLYQVSVVEPKNAEVKQMEQCHVSKEELWHRRYGHLNNSSLKELAADDLVKEFDYHHATKDSPLCEPCCKGKQHKNPFPQSSDRRAANPLDLIHSDVCGKMSSKSLSGAEYFVTFIDDKTRYVWVYIIKRKSDVFKCFCEWRSLVEKSFGRSVKCFRTDNGGEFTSDEFEGYLKDNGIKHKLTIPKSPQQNGVAERMNRTLVEMVRCMLADAQVPKTFWAEALSTACYIRNRSPTKAVPGQTPYEALYGDKPTVGHFRVFGCTAYAHIAKDERQKLDDKSRKCIFLGYSENRKGYRLYNQSKRKVIHSRDVRFDEQLRGTEEESPSTDDSPGPGDV